MITNFLSPEDSERPDTEEFLPKASGEIGACTPPIAGSREEEEELEKGLGIRLPSLDL